MVWRRGTAHRLCRRVSSEGMPCAAIRALVRMVDGGQRTKAHAPRWEAVRSRAPSAARINGPRVSGPGRRRPLPASKTRNYSTTRLCCFRCSCASKRLGARDVRCHT